jgi:hypothetical protein
MIRNLLLSVIALVTLAASSSLFAYTAPPYPDKNGDTVQNEMSDDGMTRIETRWNKAGTAVQQTTYVWNGCNWVKKAFHFWKIVNGRWQKDGLYDDATDMPNGGTAPALSMGSGASYEMSSGPAMYPSSAPVTFAQTVVGPVVRTPAIVRMPAAAPRPIVVRPH